MELGGYTSPQLYERNLKTIEDGFISTCGLMFSDEQEIGVMPHWLTYCIFLTTACGCERTLRRQSCLVNQRLHNANNEGR